VTTAVLTALLAPAVHASTPQARSEGVPALPHVFVIVLENSNYADSWGPDSKAPYLKELASEGAFLPNYYGTGHASADNYIAMTSGQPPTPPFMGDCENYTVCLETERSWPDGGRNIADQVEARGRSWRAYMESMPGRCVHPSATDIVDPYSSPYATRHDPFVYYPSIADNATRCDDHVVPYDTTSFGAELSSGTVPDFVFITPDTCSDGHDGGNPVTPCKEAGRPGGLTEVNTWLQANVPPIQRFIAEHGGALFITFDENGFSDPDCCTTGGAVGGHIGTIVLSPLVKPGTVSQQTTDHYGLLRTIEDAFGIDEHLNLAGSPGRQPITGIWRGGAR
jgi:hypothetical protein